MAISKNKIPDHENPLNIYKLFVPLEDYEYFEDFKKYPFNSGAIVHDTVNAWWLAEFSSIAYHNKNNVIGYLTDILQIPTTDIYWLDNGGTQGFVIDYQGDYIISFRGTEFYRMRELSFSKITHIVQDVLTDLKFLKKNGDRIPDSENNTVEVHAGFENVLEDVWTQLTEIIDKKKTQKIWLTGHSLGGALATISAMRLHTRVKGLYTYGCPCVGGDKLYDFFDKNLAGKVFRYVNDNDLVAKGMCMKPFKDFLPGYMHVGELKEIKENTIRSPWKIAGDIIGLDIIDHSPLFYLHGTRSNI